MNSSPRAPITARSGGPVSLLVGLACLLLGSAVLAGQDASEERGALSADPALGRITDREGNAARRGLLADRWGLAENRTRLIAGDWLRTGARGANALAFELSADAGRGPKLVLGPRGLLEIAERDRVVLLTGELSLDVPEGTTVRIDGPGDTTISVQGRAVLRAAKSALVRLDERPRWLVGYEGDASTEALGSLLATVDGRNVPLTIGYHNVTVDIRDQIARTVIEESFVNHTPRILEGVFYFPLPADASISGFAMWIDDELVQGEIVEKQRARAIYETILRERRDPGLLEWSGGNIFKARVFPIGAEKRIRIAYTQVLPKWGDTFAYHYALSSEMLRKTPLRELRIEVNASSTEELARVTCPSHDCRIRATAHAARVEFEAQEFAPDRDFELRFETKPRTDALTVVRHLRDGEGYFMLLVDAPEAPAARGSNGADEPLDLVVLADTSGSMFGPQREAQVAFIDALLGTLGPDDTLQLATCDAVTRWASDLSVEATNEHREAAMQFLEERTPLGWSDLDAAFGEAFDRLRTGTHVVYVGDGAPTSGDADAVAFAQRLTRDFAGNATFHAVVPGSRSEPVVTRGIAALGGGSVRSIGGGTDAAAVAFDLAREITTPSMRDLELRFEGIDVAAVYPERLPNLPAGGQQIVVGRFDPNSGATRGRATLTGTFAGEPVSWSSDVVLDDVEGEGFDETGNSFLPRLWARRHLDHLLAQGTSKEIRDRIIALSEDYQVITPYTSFLVLESDADRERFQVERAFRMRDGEEFFTKGRADGQHELTREQMLLSAGWRRELRAKAIARLAGLGRDLTELLRGGPRYSLESEEVVLLEFAVSDHNETDAGFSMPRSGGSPFGPRDTRSWSAGRERQDGFDESDLEPLEEEEWFEDEVADFDAPFEPSIANEALAVSSTSGDFFREGRKRSQALRQNAFPAQGGTAVDAYFGYSRRPSGRFSHASPYDIRHDGYRSLFPRLVGAPQPSKDPDWSADALSLVRALDRRASIDALDGGLVLSVATTYRDPRGRERTSRGTHVVGPNAWVLLGSHLPGHEYQIAWAAGGERGIVSAGTGLGRVRDAEEGDERGWHSPIAWHFGDSFFGYGGYDATVEEIEEGRVRLRLAHADADRSLELTIDVARALVLEQADVVEGEVTRRTVYGEFIEVGGAWWPTSIRPVNPDESHGSSRVDLEITALDGPSFQRRIDAELEIRDRSILLREEPESLVEAKQALKDGTADVDERLYLLRSYAAAQRWSIAQEHFDALAELCAGKPGLELIRWTYLSQSRQHDELNRRLLASARTLAETPQDGEYGLADRMIRAISGHAGDGERLRVLEALRPVIDRHQGDGLTTLTWNRYTMQSLRSLGRTTAALAMLERMLAEDPALVDLQVEYARILAKDGEIERALDHLARVEAEEGPWQDYQVLHLRRTAAQILWDSYRLADFVDLVGGWVRDEPTSVDTQLANRWLSAHVLLDREDRAERLIESWLSLDDRDELEPYEVARLQAAVQHLLGRGYGLYQHRLEADRTTSLASAARALAAREDDHGQVQAIIGHYKFRQSDEGRALVLELFEALRAGASTLPVSAVVRRVGWLRNASDVPGLERDDVDAVFEALLARWKETEAGEDRDALANVLLGGQRPQLQARLFRHLAESPKDEEERLRAIRGLSVSLTQLPWTPEREAELLGLVARLRSNEADDEDGTEANLIERILLVHDLATWIPRARVEAAIEALPEQNELTRRQMKARRAGALRVARRAASKALSALEGRAELPALRRWITIERTWLDVRTRSSIADVRRDTLALLAALAEEHADTDEGGIPLRDRVLAARCATTQTYLMTRYADEERAKHEPPFRAIVEAGLEAESELVDWRGVEATLLLALDRGDALEARLAAWYGGGEAFAQIRWGRDLAHVMVERGDLERALALFREVEALDELTHDDYRTVAGLLTALDRPEEAREAKIRSWEVVDEQELGGRLKNEAYALQRRGNGVPVEIDDEVPLRLIALMRRSSQPSRWIEVVQSYHRPTKDFRVLECLPEAVLGRSTQEVYLVLRSLRRSTELIQEEATVDRLVAHARERLASVNSGVDRRALRLLEFAVVQRAAQQGVGTAKHVESARAALLACEKAEWTDGEPRLMAHFLESLGALRPEALADEQLRVLSLLRGEADDPDDRLAIAVSHAKTLWAHGRQEEAIRALEGALASRRESTDGLLPVEANVPLAALGTWYEAVGSYAKAESQWQNELRLARTVKQRLWMERAQLAAYRNAVLAEARVSLGEGEELYVAVRGLLLEAIARRTNEYHLQQLVQIATDLWRRGHQNLRYASIPDDVAVFAFVRLPGVLDLYQYRGAQRPVGDVSDCLESVRGAVTSLEFLVARAEAEPAWLRRQNQDFWSSHAGRLGKLRCNAGTLSPSLELRALTIVLQELRADLESRQQRSRSMYDVRQSRYWSEKAAEFERAALDVIELHPGSGPTIVYAAEYLFHGVSAHGPAIDALEAANRRGLLDVDARQLLATFLQTRERWQESIPVLEALAADAPERVEVRVMLMRGHFHVEAREALVAAHVEAIAWFRENDRWDEDVIAALAHGCLETELLGEAVDHFEEAIALHVRAAPNRGVGGGSLSNYYSYLARTLSRLGRTDEAVDAAAGGIVAWGRGQNGRANALSELESVLRSAEDLDDYVARFDATCREDGVENPILRRALGKVYLERRRWADAARQLDLALEGAPGDMETYPRLIAAYDGMDRPDLAAEATLRWARAAEVDLAVLDRLFRRYEGMERTGAAARALTQFVEAMPHESQSHRAVALALESRDRWAEAEERWRNVIRIRTHEPEGYTGVARSYIRRGMADEARAAIDVMLEQEWDERFDRPQIERIIEALRREARAIQ
ncbi:MAG: VIT domain-containing protein [Planctomycetota bacterium]